MDYYSESKKRLDTVVIDLKIAFDRVLREAERRDNHISI